MFSIKTLNLVITMKIRIGLILLAALWFVVMGCDLHQQKTKTVRGSWKVTEKEVLIGDINHVLLYIPGDLHIEVGEKPELRITADDNVLQYLTTREMEGKLEIMAEAGVKIGNHSIYTTPTNDQEPYHINRKVGVRLIPRRRIKYYLTVRDLEGITSWNNANVTTSDLEGEMFSIVTGSSGLTMGRLTAKEVTIYPGGRDGNWYDTHMREIEINGLHTEKLKVQINSNQNVKIGSGEVHRQEIIINNQGDFDALEVHSIEADVQVNGTGSVFVNVTKRLNVHLRDYSGNVYYTGEPEITERRESEASGELIKIQK